MKSVGEDALLNLINEVRSNTASIRSHDHDLWYVVCVLRGPDSGDSVLKDKFTVPIRAWVSRDWNHAIGSTTSSKILSLSEFVDLREEATKKAQDLEMNPPLSAPKHPDHHYLDHIRLALNVIITIETNKEQKAQ